MVWKTLPSLHGRIMSNKATDTMAPLFKLLSAPFKLNSNQIADVVIGICCGKHCHPWSHNTEHSTRDLSHPGALLLQCSNINPCHSSARQEMLSILCIMTCVMAVAFKECSRTLEAWRGSSSFKERLGRHQLPSAFGHSVPPLAGSASASCFVAFYVLLHPLLWHPGPVLLHPVLSHSG